MIYRARYYDKNDHAIHEAVFDAGSLSQAIGIIASTVVVPPEAERVDVEPATRGAPAAA